MQGYSANYAWKVLIKDIISHGRVQESRGLMHLELIGTQRIVSMEYPIVIDPTRNLSYNFMAAEAHWMLTGDNKVAPLAKYASSIGRFSDDGETMTGAYGPKIVDQLIYVVNALHDQGSRQAVMTIWERNPKPSKDIPCTISLQFLFRDERLHTIATMRSSDTWLGWPYDVFSFTMISALVSILVSPMKPVPLGLLTMQCGSQHLYLDNLGGALNIDFDMGYTLPRFDVTKFKMANDLVSWLADAAEKGDLCQRL